MSNPAWRQVLYILRCMAVFSPYITAKSTLFDAEFLAYKKDVIGRSIFKKGYYDAPIINFLLKKSSPKNAVYLDIGANLGYYSVLFSRLAGSGGTVYAFEPEPNNFDILKKNIEKNHCTNLKPFPVALGNKEEELTLGLYRSSNRGRHSLAKDFGFGTVKVPVKRLDDIINEEAIDVMKLDVEGYEPYVLQGAEKTLPKVNSLILEFSPATISESNISTTDYINMLAKYFNKCYRFSPNEDLTEINFTDLLHNNIQIDLLLSK